MKTKTYKFVPEEWFTPNTYDRNFKSPTENSGVYLIVRPIFRGDNSVSWITDYDILYIGSAKNLKIRYSNHEVLRILSQVFSYLQFYFKEEKNYKTVERDLIKRIEPKFNQQWR